jgi:hypothetical protein
VHPSKAATASGSSTPVPKASSLAKFSGRGDETTTTFRAASNWEIRWRTESGSPFTVELLDASGVSRGQIVTSKKKVTGATFVSEKGQFKLKVSATRAWSIEIIGRPLAG